MVLIWIEFVFQIDIVGVLRLVPAQDIHFTLILQYTENNNSQV